MKKSLILSCYVLTLLSCRREVPDVVSAAENTSPPGRNEIFAVEAIVVRQDTFYKNLEAIARITPAMTTELSFQVNGRLVELFVRSGEIFDKGEPIARIHDDVLELDRQIAESNLKLAQIEFESLLLGLGGDSTRLNNQIIENLKLRAGITEARSALERSKIGLQKCLLIAPFSGKVVLEDIYPGMYLPAGEKIGIIYDINNYRAEFWLPVKDANRLDLFDRIYILPVSSAGISIKAEQLSIGNSVNEFGWISLVINFSSPETTFADGTRGIVKIQLLQGYGPVIPREAPVNQSGEPVVLKAVRGKAVWQNIQVRSENDQYFLVSDGLQTGDTVLVDGHFFLSHNSEININRLIQY